MKSKYYVLATSLILSFLQGISQSDSLKLLLKKAKHDTIKVRLLNTMVESEPDIKTWIPYNEEMLALVKKNLASNPSPEVKKVFLIHEAKYYVNSAYITFNDGNMDSTASLYKTSLKFFDEAGDKKGYANAMHNLASVLSMQDKNTEAMDYLQKSLGIVKEINDLNELCIVYNKIAQIYYYQSNITKALEYYHSSLKMARQMSNKQNEAAMLNNIASIYNDQHDYDKALEYYTKGLEIVSKINDNIGHSTFVNNLGSTYLELKNFPQALKYFTEGLEMRKAMGDKNGITDSYINIGAVYLRQDSFQKARSYYDIAIPMAKKLKNKKRLSSVLNYMANSYILENQFSKALPFELRAYEISKELGYPENLRDASKNLCVIYEHNGDYKKAYEMHKLFVIMRDSIYSIKTKKAALKSQLRYDFEKKAAADSVKVAEEKKITTLQLKQEETTRYALYIGLVLVLIFAGFMVNRFKISQRQKNIISQQKHIVEEKQKEIIDSINYAKRIQSALLAHKDFLNENIPNNFVLFKPKDIVSGDFYWATKHNDRFYLAVCDSTGHGVPGAFMSLLNIGFLSEAINEKNIAEPHLVFNYVRQRLIDGISKEGQKDGFDGILLCIDQKTKKMSYTAAHNAPIIIRNNEIIELAKDKMPVGKGERTDSFTTHTIELLKEDTLYLYTDGYADQFGGPKGKKFLYKRLNDLLRSISAENIHNHGDKLNFKFEEWRGNLEQVDDVCVIGIKI